MNLNRTSYGGLLSLVSLIISVVVFAWAATNHSFINYPIIAVGLFFGFLSFLLVRFGL